MTAANMNFRIASNTGLIPPNIHDGIRAILTQAASHGRNLSLDLDISSLDQERSTDLGQVIRAIIAKVRLASSSTALEVSPRLGSTVNAAADTSEDVGNLPKTIQFPYSRHSSYPELCAFVNVFRPKDVWPCTANPQEWFRYGRITSVGA